MLINVFGQFPPSSLNTLLGPDEVTAAMNRTLKESQYTYSQKRLGVDIGEYGDDPTVLFPRQGLAALSPAEMRNASGPEIAARVKLAKSRWSQEQEFFDCTGGYGNSAYDSCLMAGISPIRVNFAGKAADPGYYNKRAEMWFAMAQWIKRGGAPPERARIARRIDGAHLYDQKRQDASRAKGYDQGPPRQEPQLRGTRWR